MKIAVAISGFLCVMMFCLSMMQRNKRCLANRLQEIKRFSEEGYFSQKQVGEPREIRNRIPKVKINFSSLNLKKDWILSFEKKLLQANIPLRVEELVVGEVAINTILTTLVFVFTHDCIMSLLSFTLVLFAPFFWIRIAKQKRIKRFNLQIGESLNVISNSLKAGYGFLYAIEVVSKEMPEPISQEFGKVIQEINLGITTEQALINLTERVGSEDLDLIVTALLIQRQVGGNLAEVLDNISKTIRERIRISGEIKTLTAQGRISGMIIGLLPIGLGVVLYLVNPSYISILFNHPVGLAMIGGGLFNMIIGFLLIKKIITIEV